MKKLIAIFVCVAVTAGCSTPTPPSQPSGAWTPVNAPHTQKG